MKMKYLRESIASSDTLIYVRYLSLYLNYFVMRQDPGRRPRNRRIQSERKSGELAQQLLSDVMKNMIGIL